MTNEELEFVFDAVAEQLDKTTNKELFLAKLAMAQANENDLASFKRAFEVALDSIIPYSIYIDADAKNLFA